MTVYSVSTLSRTGCIPIGYATETGVTEIGFDFSVWLERWPDMTVEVWVTAPGASSAYEAKTHLKGYVVVWEVMQSDTQTPGAGRVEVIGYTADKRKLSATVSTRIDESMLMAEGAEPPEAQQPWYTAAQEAKARAEALARHAPIIEDGMWMLWDPDKGAYVNSGVQAEGGSGLPEGAGPWMQLVTGADGVARWEERLAYSYTERTTLLDSATVEYTDLLDAIIKTRPSGVPEDGSTVYVTVDGVTQEMPCKHVPAGDYLFYVVGNMLHFTGEDNGLPLAFFGRVDNMPMVDESNEERTSYIAFQPAVGNMPPSGSKVTLEVMGEKVKPIDLKYLQGVVETVILAEAAYTVDAELAGAVIESPLSGDVAAGDMCTVKWNGTKYECAALDGSAMGLPGLVLLGNIEAMTGDQITGGNTDAPFVIMLLPDGMDDDGNGVLEYGSAMPLDGATSFTMSIVKGSGSGASGGVDSSIFTVRWKSSTSYIDDSTVMSDPDKSWLEVYAAYNAGKVIRVIASNTDDNGVEYEYIGEVRQAMRTVEGGLLLHVHFETVLKVTHIFMYTALGLEYCIG